MCEPLTDKEIIALRKLVTYADVLEQQGRYRSSVQIVTRTWRQSIVLYAGVIVGTITFWDKISTAIMSVLKKALGLE